MSAVLAAIGAAASLASSIIGSVSSANQTRKNRALIDTAEKQRTKWHQDYQSRDLANSSSYRVARKETEDMLNKFNERERATMINIGGTNEAKEVSKAQAYKAAADMATAAASESEAKKDAENNQYIQDMNAYNQQKMGLNSAQAANTAQAASQGISAGLNMLSAGLESGVGNAGSGSSGSGTFVNPGKTQLAADIKASNNPPIGTPAAILGTDQLPKVRS